MKPAGEAAGNLMQITASPRQRIHGPEFERDKE